MSVVLGGSNFEALRFPKEIGLCLGTSAFLERIPTCALSEGRVIYVVYAVNELYWINFHAYSHEPEVQNFFSLRGYFNRSDSENKVRVLLQKKYAKAHSFFGCIASTGLQGLFSA